MCVSMYLCVFSLEVILRKASVEGEKEKKKIDLPHSLQCCNHWVCTTVSLYLLMPQLQGRHQVVRLKSAVFWKEFKLMCKERREATRTQRGGQIFIIVQLLFK